MSNDSVLLSGQNIQELLSEGDTVVEGVPFILKHTNGTRLYIQRCTDNKCFTGMTGAKVFHEGTALSKKELKQKQFKFFLYNMEEE